MSIRQRKLRPRIVGLTVLGLCLWGGTSIGWSAAAEQHAPVANNRYLLLVETSRSMQRRTDSVFETVHELLASGMKGQLHSGDTVGVWTYNDTVHAGEFPLQHASTTNHLEIADSTVMFLRQQKFEKTPSLKQLIPMLVQVVQNSPFITIIFVGSGDNDFFGTPYDQAINSIYQEWRGKQAREGKPLVTILRARQGKLTDFGVHPIPSLKMPPLPPELVEVAAAAAPAKPVSTPKGNRALIVSGKKPSFPNAEAASPVPAVQGTSSEDQQQGRGTVIAATSENVSSVGAGIDVKAIRRQSEASSESHNASAVTSVAGRTSEPGLSPLPLATNAKANANSTLNPAVNTATESLSSKSRVGLAQAKPNTIDSIEETRTTAKDPTAAGTFAAKGPHQAAPPSDVPTRIAKKGKSHSFGSGVLMLLGFGCATVAAFGLVYVVVFKRRTPQPQTSIVTRSLQRQSMS